MRLPPLNCFPAVQKKSKSLPAYAVLPLIKGELRGITININLKCYLDNSDIRPIPLTNTVCPVYAEFHKNPIYNQKTCIF